jgi:hypothetical protein
MLNYWPLILVLVVGMLILCHKKGYINLPIDKIKGGASVTSKIIINIIIWLVAYGLILAMLPIVRPIFWESWNTPQSFFIISNLAILAGILVINITKKTILGYVIIIVACIFIYNNYRSYSTRTNTSASSRSEYSNTPKEEVLVLEYDTYTPCNVALEIGQKFELDTQGDPIYLEFPGLARVYYSGKGEMKLPKGRTEGVTRITSADPSVKARIRIWKKKLK